MNLHNRDRHALRLADTPNACADCEIQHACLPATLSKQEASDLGRLIRPIAPIAAGDPVYRLGEKFRGLFLLRRGVIKTEKLTAGGLLNIVAFYLKGDLFGGESLFHPIHVLDAIALKNSDVCQLPSNLLGDACRQVPSLQHILFQRLGDALRDSQECSHCLLEHKSETRVLSFFVKTFERLERIKPLNPDCFWVPLSKGDIAAHLHMRAETFSRALVKLARGALLRGLGASYWSFPNIDRAYQELARLRQA
jgi:CRP/FNR family transcriptional regulator